MPDAPRPARRVPRGEPLDSTDAELDAASVVTPEDIESARQWFRRNAAPEFRDLLDAAPNDDAT